MLSTIFIPAFTNSFAITCGIGAGVILTLIGTLLFLIASLPITKRFKN